MGFRVWCFRVYGLGFGFQGLGFIGLRFGLSSLGFRV